MRMQKGQKCHMSRLQPRRQKSEGMQPSTFLFGGACRRPSLKHARAPVTTLLQRASPSIAAVQAVVKQAVVDITA
ncbi:hypothetical protein, partial [Priestia megaterium]|uniref:hypothetical protein n=1 Tax=Priestia megaterium TaxID=1404 RepID=UPI0039B05678